jgi:hypothetical protein
MWLLIFMSQYSEFKVLNLIELDLFISDRALENLKIQDKSKAIP